MEGVADISKLLINTQQALLRMRIMQVGAVLWLDSSLHWHVCAQELVQL
jgi:hypothetical protein